MCVSVSLPVCECVHVCVCLYFCLLHSFLNSPLPLSLSLFLAPTPFSSPSSLSLQISRLLPLSLSHIFFFSSYPRSLALSPLSPILSFFLSPQLPFSLAFSHPFHFPILSFSPPLSLPWFEPHLNDKSSFQRVNQIKDHVGAQKGKGKGKGKSK